MIQRKPRVRDKWWDRADAPHDGIPFTRSVPSPSGEGANATEHVELMPDGSLQVFKTTRGDPKAKVGRYEEWFPNGRYVLRENGEGRDYHFEIWEEGIEQEHREQNNNLTFSIQRLHDGSILDSMVESEDLNYPFWMRYGVYHNELVIRQAYGEAYSSEGTPIGSDDFVEIAKGIYSALKRNDTDAVDSFVADLKARCVSSDTRYSVSVADCENLKANFRNAKVVEEAGQIFRSAGVIGKPLTNDKLGMTVTISGNNLSKMTSEKATSKSISPRLHALAVANADTIFEAAFVDATHPDTHGRKEVTRTHRLGSALYDAEYGRYEPVLITVLEYLRDGRQQISSATGAVRSMPTSTFL